MGTMQWPVRYICAALCAAAVAACGGGGGSTGGPPPPPTSSPPAPDLPAPDLPGSEPPGSDPPASHPPVTQLLAEWSGHSFFNQGVNEMHAALLDTGDPQGLELWSVHLGRADIHQVARLVRGDIPRTRTADSFSAQLTTLDFSLGTVAPGTWEIGLTPDGFSGWPDNSSASPSALFWESAAPIPSPDAPDATAILQETTWDLVLGPVQATTPREFQVTTGLHGRIETIAGACSLRGQLQALSVSGWFKLDLTLSGCGPGQDAESLRGYGKLLMNPVVGAERDFLRFVGAVFTGDGRTALSVSARPVSPPE
jgi:hypothetical protein